MRARFDTLFGRLFGVLLLAIVLAHVLAFLWFRHYGPPPPLLRRRNFPSASTDNAHHRTRASATGRHGRGSVGRWCR